MLPTAAASVAIVLRPIWAARTAEREKFEIRRGATILKAQSNGIKKNLTFEQCKKKKTEKRKRLENIFQHIQTRDFQCCKAGKQAKKNGKSLDKSGLGDGNDWLI